MLDLLFRDKRVKSIGRLCSAIVGFDYLNVFTMSADKRKYDVFRGLVKGERLSHETYGTLTLSIKLSKRKVRLPYIFCVTSFYHTKVMQKNK